MPIYDDDPVLDMLHRYIAGDRSMTTPPDPSEWEQTWSNMMRDTNPETRPLAVDLVAATNPVTDTLMGARDVGHYAPRALGDLKANALAWRDYAANLLRGEPGWSEENPPVLAPSNAVFAGLGALPGVSAGIVIGRKGAKQLGRLDDYERALNMDGTPEEIFAKTGWWQGPDGQWRTEISDDAARLNMDALPKEPNVYDLADEKLGLMPQYQHLPEGLRIGNPKVSSADQQRALDWAQENLRDGGVIPLSEAFTHDELMRAYPDAEGMRVGRQSGSNLGGSYSPINDEMRVGGGLVNTDPRSTALHELQHAIQHREGFATGGSPSQFSSVDVAYQNALNAANDLYRKYDAWKHGEWDDGLGLVDADWQRMMDSADAKVAALKVEHEKMLSPYENYRRLAGEVEARTVQSRRDLTAAQRAQRPFWQDYDVPTDEQIVRYGKELAEMKVFHGSPHRFAPEVPFYHGTVRGDIGDWETSVGGAGSAMARSDSPPGTIWFTDSPETANTYTRGRVPKDGGRAIYRQSLDLKNPLEITPAADGAIWNQIEMPDGLDLDLSKDPRYAGFLRPGRTYPEIMDINELARVARDQGHDGLIVHNVWDAGSKRGAKPATSIAVFDSETIKDYAPFGRFRSDAIGSGEGAQAFGYGHYLAEKPGTAGFYKANQSNWWLSLDGERLPSGDLPRGFHNLSDIEISDLNVIKKRAAFDPINPNPSIDELIEKEVAGSGIYRQVLRQPGDVSSAHYEAAREYVNASDRRIALIEKLRDRLEPTQGHLYTVDLPDEAIDQMLDWDAPFNQQPENVRRALDHMQWRDEYNVGGRRLTDFVGSDVLGVKLQSALRETGGDIGAAIERLKSLGGNENWQQMVAGLRDKDWLNLQFTPVRKPNYTGEDIVRELGRGPEASESLRAAGIPGIRFLDQGSRAAGEGTRNFVVFPGNEHLMRIVGRE